MKGTFKIDRPGQGRLSKVEFEYRTTNGVLETKQMNGTTNPQWKVGSIPSGARLGGSNSRCEGETYAPNRR